MIRHTTNIQMVSDCLCAGGIAIYPTETVMALGCRADDGDAVRRVFDIKKRPLSKPLPLILGSKKQLSLVCSIPESLLPDVTSLISLWPAPLTLLLPSASNLPSLIVSNDGYVAVRVSSHPLARQLAESVGFALVSTSANLSGMPASACSNQIDTALLRHLDREKDIVLEYKADCNNQSASTIIKVCGNGVIEVIRNGCYPIGNLLKNGFKLER